MTDRLQEMFETKKESTRRFRTVQHNLGMIEAEQITDAYWGSREGCVELHKGIHWINLELAEFLGAAPDDRPEELADVLHFLMEFCLIAGLTYEVILPADSGSLDRLDIIFTASEEDPFVFSDADTNARFTMHAALHIAELLKNKPWKQTLKREMDWEEFQKRVRGLWYWFGATCRTEGLSAEKLYDEYMRKEEINANRVASGV